MRLRRPVAKQSTHFARALLPKRPKALTEEIRLEIFASADLPDYWVHLLRDASSEWRILRLLMWKLVWNVGDSRDNVFDIYGASREKLLEILAVVIILSPISSVRGGPVFYHAMTTRCMQIHEENRKSPRFFQKSHTFQPKCPVFNHVITTRCIQIQKDKRKSPALYGVATISRLLYIIGLFRKRALYKRQCSAKATYPFKEPTSHSHPRSKEPYMQHVKL